mmetsp:Transcript_8953/g.55062  ORF Transcript_8953/g.55062 Transcript_8953/m.55062 type:complete len:200 (+) Transcript_8953:1872-2471(+)
MCPGHSDLAGAGRAADPGTLHSRLEGGTLRCEPLLPTEQWFDQLSVQIPVQQHHMELHQHIAVHRRMHHTVPHTGHRTGKYRSYTQRTDLDHIVSSHIAHLELHTETCHIRRRNSVGHKTSRTGLVWRLDSSLQEGLRLHSRTAGRRCFHSYHKLRHIRLDYADQVHGYAVCTQTLRRHFCCVCCRGWMSPPLEEQQVQ